MKEIVHKLDFIKIKNSVLWKTTSRIRRYDWQKIFAKGTLDKSVYLWTLYLLKTSNAICKWAKIFKRHPRKKDMQVAKMHVERCSASDVIREMQIQTTMRHHDTPIRMATVWNPDSHKWWQGCGETGTLIHCWWERRRVQPLWKTVW